MDPGALAVGPGVGDTLLVLFSGQKNRTESNASTEVKVVQNKDIDHG